MGGGVQDDYVNRFGSQVSFDVPPAEHFFYEMQYRGFDFERAGDAFYNLPGLA